MCYNFITFFSGDIHLFLVLQIRVKNVRYNHYISLLRRCLTSDFIKTSNVFSGNIKQYLSHGKCNKINHVSLCSENVYQRSHPIWWCDFYSKSPKHIWNKGILSRVDKNLDGKVNMTEEQTNDPKPWSIISVCDLIKLKSLWTEQWYDYKMWQRWHKDLTSNNRAVKHSKELPLDGHIWRLLKNTTALGAIQNDLTSEMCRTSIFSCSLPSSLGVSLPYIENWNSLQVNNHSPFVYQISELFTGMF